MRSVLDSAPHDGVSLSSPGATRFMTSTTPAPMPIMLELARLASEHPDTPAVGDLNQQFTYGETLVRVRALASVLAQRPDAGHTVVFVAQRAEAVIALLASLWAGRGVVPLDSSEPTERLETLVRRARPALIIDAAGTGVSSFAGVPVVDATRPHSGNTEPLPAHDDDPGVILFTSGSTGAPKSVVRSVHDLNKCLVDPPLFGTGSTGMCVPLHFAGGFTAAVHGVVTDRPITMIDVRSISLPDLATRVRALDLTRLMFTPSLARTLARTLAGRARFETVTDVYLMGEALEWADVPTLRTMAAPSATITIPMGASEAVNALFMMTITPDMPLGSGRVPLGVPTVPSRVHLEPIDDGAGLAQLIGREGVVAGYWDNTDQQEARFGIDEHGVRFWNSGDLVELGDDGEYYHRGRIDDTMKVNGRLVEPSEVEAALTDIADIVHAVVLPHALPSGRTLLVAHIEAPPATDLAAIRRTLRHRLPEYLVPAHVVRHDELPLNTRGKIDRAAIATMPLPRVGETTRTTVIDPLVQAVQGTLASILELPDIGLDDDIWDLGCDSFAAVEITSALVADHPSDIDPNSLLTARTVRQICELLHGSHHHERSHVVTMNAGGARTPIFLVAGAGSPALTYRPLANALREDQPLVIYEQYGLHQHVEPDTSIAEIAERNLRHLREHHPTGRCDLVAYSWGGFVAHHMASRLLAEGREVRMIGLEPSAPSPTPSVLRKIAGRARAVLAMLRRPGGVLRATRSRLTLAPIGTTARYDLYYRKAIGAVGGYELTPLDLEMLLVAQPESLTEPTWVPSHRLRTVATAGDHFSMLQPPWVSQTAAAISDFIG
ncbi:MAG: AMP-binding protein [Actinobacteria bacterium]|nr:AMP-binding protein [Actinomycetota bacterium]MSZ84605.1 AMP-binding protein [Actinomycetota bacterium]